MFENHKKKKTFYKENWKILGPSQTRIYISHLIGHVGKKEVRRLKSRQYWNQRGKAGFLRTVYNGLKCVMWMQPLRLYVPGCFLKLNVYSVLLPG